VGLYALQEINGCSSDSIRDSQKHKERDDINSIPGRDGILRLCQQFQKPGVRALVPQFKENIHLRQLNH
jgi:hypothetical protein